MIMKTTYQGAIEIKATIMRVMEPATGRYARTPQEIVDYCADMRDAAQEMFVVVCLNTRNRIIDRVMVSLGIQDSYLVHPREVFRPAILKSAAAIVLVHNHPSGDPSHSAEDVRLTRQLIQAGQIISINVLDHMIIGRSENGSKGYLSFRESEVVEFNS
jgi:DNA repair protein RadC